MPSTTETAELTGSASRWGPLWGARPADWALSEDQQVPTYEEALRYVVLEPGQSVLDIGSGVGAFLRLVADRGARPVRDRCLRSAAGRGPRAPAGRGPAPRGYGGAALRGRHL